MNIYPKFNTQWYRWRAALMTKLWRDGYTYQAIADRFGLSLRRTLIIIDAWRKR
jgi:hypothetical protein